MANSPNKFGSAPGKTALSLDLLVSVPTALELLLRAKLLLIHAIVAHRREPVACTCCHRRARRSVS